MSTLLDPRSKQCKFLSTSKLFEVKLTLITESKHQQDNDSQETQPSTSQSHLQSHVTALNILLGDEDNGSESE